MPTWTPNELKLHQLKSPKAQMIAHEIRASKEHKLETKIKAQCISWLEQHSGLNIKVGTAFNHKKSTYTEGWPDLTFAVNGKPVAIELKTDEGVVSQEQRLCHEQMRGNGWLVFVCRSLEEVIKTVRSI